MTRPPSAPGYLSVVCCSRRILLAPAASTAVRLSQPEPVPTLADNEKTVALPEIANDQPTDRRIRLAYRVIAPDLPGFGDSSHVIADYSFRAHAFYLRNLMDTLGIGEAHSVGYSMGGGAAYNLYDIAPKHVRSITLLSSLGVR